MRSAGESLTPGKTRMYCEPPPRASNVNIAVGVSPGGLDGEDVAAGGPAEPASPRLNPTAAPTPRETATAPATSGQRDRRGVADSDGAGAARLDGGAARFPFSTKSVRKWANSRKTA